ncbi:sigma factor-like helix-turn-helix DNA-binding protein [Microbacterium awajiense]|uniref:Sigma factor-like helix-turn-helix DNA-binding protein n=1 Tax=Microbacterium awajiense TaxID=415214 RepID=A0ABP7AC65_9MICO
MAEAGADSPAVEAVIERVHREEWARIVAALMRRFRDLDIAEEAAAEGFATAVERWPREGVPPNPGAWIMTTAHRKGIDRLRGEARRKEMQQEAHRLSDDTPHAPMGVIDDDRLRLVFTCCDPILPVPAQVALTLRIVGGLTVTEIAKAFLVQETTMGQRISRAKAKIRAARIPYRVPDREDLPARAAGVLAVLYLVFNEGYLSSGERSASIRRDLTGEAIRLARLMRDLLPDGSSARREAAGLLSLMLLTEARAPARVSATGELVRLDEQDRTAWDRPMIREGLEILQAERIDAGADVDDGAGRYELLAAVNAVHASAASPLDTDWSRIAALYERIERIDPSPVVMLGRAVAIAELGSPAAGLALLTPLKGTLDGYHAFHATRAELLRRVDRRREARAAYNRAIELAVNPAEIAHLSRRRNQLAEESVGSPHIPDVPTSPDHHT